MTKSEFYWKIIERPKRIVYYWIYNIFKFDNEKIIQKEVDKHRYELVIDPAFDIVKLYGWTSQYEDDLYYIVYNPKHNGIEFISCVGGLIWLKNKLSGFHYYARMVDVWNLNEPCDKDILKEIKRRKIKLR